MSEKKTVKEDDLVIIESEELHRDDSRTETIWQTILGGLLVIFNIAVRLYCALYMIISDCDETFNYWEPLNLITRQFGKQTWEYSPAYAIRSYLYLLPYHLVTFPLRDFIHITGIKLPSYYFFYYIRVVALCGFTSFAEYKVFQSVRRNFSSFAANWFLLFSTVSAGMSHAGVAFLPSSFAMQWIMLATAAAFDVLTLKNTFESVTPSVFTITCFLVSGIIGWPFTLAVGFPFGIFTLASRFQTTPLIHIVLKCTAVFIFIMWLLITVDSYIYDRIMLFVPFNIVFYNVFSLPGEGPEIFGTEPFSYYVKNLFLNFNVVAILAYVGSIVNPIFFKGKLRTFVGITVPLLLWSYIFGSQAHKEERFLYPIYPLISLSAAIFTSNIFELSRGLHMKWLTRLVSMLSMTIVAVVSLLRIVNLVENYSAPLVTASVFDEIARNSTDTQIKNVCVGREWYHFPTSFFLPDNYRLRFIASGFDGLLPGDFPENVPLMEAASRYPKGMNTKNEFSPDKLVDLEVCDFIIDNSSPVNAEINEIQFVSKKDGKLEILNGWHLVSHEKIIRPEGAHRGIGKFIYVPEALRGLLPYDVEYMDYCVLAREEQS